MGRSPCCDDQGLKKGPWTPEEDKRLTDYIQQHGVGSWRTLPKHAGLNRCGKSCRLRWTNYLRPDIKRGKFSEEEERLIVHLHSVLGNKWSAMATRLPGRTDNEIKNYWNTHLKKKLLHMGIDPVTHCPRADLALLANLSTLLPPAATNMGSLGSNTWVDGALRLPDADTAAHLASVQLLQSLVRAIIANSITPSSADLVSLLGSAFLRSSPSATDLLRPGCKFPSLVDGALGLVHDGGMDPSGLTSSLGAAIPHISGDDLHLLGQLLGTSLGGTGLVPPAADVVSSSNASTFDNTGSTGDYQMSSSYSNVPTAASTPSLASASPEYVAVDQFQEMIYAGENKHWGELSEPASDFYWKDVLDPTVIESCWPSTS